MNRFEDVSARFGLEGQRVRGVATLDEKRVAFLLGQEIAVADGRHVTRYATGPLQGLEGGGGKAVAVGRDALVVFDGGSLSARTYTLHGVKEAAVGNDGRVYALTSRALFATAKDGDLSLLYDAQVDSLHGLAASGSHVWFADGSELGLVQGDHVAESNGAAVPRDALLFSSPSGDVWVLSHGDLRRFRNVEDRASAGASAWVSTIAPVFARSCSACHLPSGISGTDLSTSTAWQSEREAIRQRVVVTRSMPPEGHPLSEVERATIGAWVSGPR
jgi:mono/diheme cytochrome c family protein